MDHLANAVRITLGPKGPNVVLEKKKNGKTVGKAGHLDREELPAVSPTLTFLAGWLRTLRSGGPTVERLWLLKGGDLPLASPCPTISP